MSQMKADDPIRYLIEHREALKVIDRLTHDCDRFKDTSAMNVGYLKVVVDSWRRTAGNISNEAVKQRFALLIREGDLHLQAGKGTTLEIPSLIAATETFHKDLDSGAFPDYYEPPK
jgi:hypothetical protein